MDPANNDEGLELWDGESSNQGVYIYHSKQSRDAAKERSSKKRKRSKEPSRQVEDDSIFLPLLSGKEPPDLVRMRQSTFERLWAVQEKRCKEELQKLDYGILQEIKSFVNNASPGIYGGRIPTALVSIGSNVSAFSRLLDSLHQDLLAEGRGQVVLLESGDAPNPKTVLRNIIRHAVTNTEGNDGYQRVFTDRPGPRMLPYDLNILYEYVKEKSVERIILALRDSEAFDQGVLTDLLSMISSWCDRIPFTLFFGIATSVELFEGRLSRSTVARLQGRHFEIHDAGDSVDQIYSVVQAGQQTRLWLGANISSHLFERAKDHFQSPEAFIRQVKYAYMSHFFANPVSVLLSDQASTALRQKELCQALRNLPSFRRHCEELLDEGKYKYVRELLDDDSVLAQEVISSLQNNLEQMQNLFEGVRAVEILQTTLQVPQIKKRTELLIRATSGDLKDSLAIMTDIVIRARKLDSNAFADLLAVLSGHLIDVPNLEEYRTDLDTLVKSHSSGGGPLRSEHDDQTSTVHATVTNKRINLSKGKKKLTSGDILYTRLLENFLAKLETYLNTVLIQPSSLFLHEVFIFDLRNPLKDSFAPRARFSIERALRSPFDYLVAPSSDSQLPEDTNLSSRQPETAILYQLYLESGSLINVFDLWKAFWTIIGGEDEDACDERLALMRFYRSLAELKALGMVKPTKKKVDHVSKTTWMGL